MMDHMMANMVSLVGDILNYVVDMVGEMMAVMVDSMISDNMASSQKRQRKYSTCIENTKFTSVSVTNRINATQIALEL